MPEPYNSENPAKLPRTLLQWLRLWFLLRDPVRRREYAISGFGLMALKYLVEAIVVSRFSGQLYTLLDFVNPLLTTREALVAGAPEWFGMAWVIWSLPFLWVAVGMSLRRALDAGISPWHGLWVLVPFANLVAMPVFACLPSAPGEDLPSNAQVQHNENRTTNPGEAVEAAVIGIVAGALYVIALVIAAVYVFHEYGVALFFGTPLIIGAATAYWFNRRSSRTYGATICVVLTALGVSALALLLFALEGAICIAMAAPIVLPLGIAGAVVGKFLADINQHRHGGVIGALLFVPLLAAFESRIPSPRALVVSSAVDVAARPEVVWRNVIDFSSITERPEWFFRMGIACPSEARISGDGVGAIRECIFTTGKFVEPITAWDAPRRLAFDVREQPAPMFELTPYRSIHPPHLDFAFRSTRGEFELVGLPDGHTRLIGRTWYALDIRPVAYWTIWSDWIVHRIHERVLRNIKRTCEEETAM